MISSRDEIKRCIAAKRENCLGIFWEGCIANISVEIVLGFWVRNFIGTQRCWCGCKLHGRDIWREDIVVPYVTTYAVTLRMRLQSHTINDFFGVRNICRWYFWFEILYTQRCWWGSKLHGIDIWRRDTQCPALRCASECKQL